MDFLCVRLAWSNAPGSVALLLRPPFSSSCVRISHATPLESAAACVNEYASFQWCFTPHLALHRGNNRGHNTGADEKLYQAPSSCCYLSPGHNIERGYCALKRWRAMPFWTSANITA